MDIIQDHSEKNPNYRGAGIAVSSVLLLTAFLDIKRICLSGRWQGDETLAAAVRALSEKDARDIHIDTDENIPMIGTSLLTADFYINNILKEGI